MTTHYNNKVLFLSCDHFNLLEVKRIRKKNKSIISLTLALNVDIFYFKILSNINFVNINFERIRTR